MLFLSFAIKKLNDCKIVPYAKESNFKIGCCFALIRSEMASFMWIIKSSTMAKEHATQTNLMSGLISDMRAIWLGSATTQE